MPQPTVLDHVAVAVERWADGWPRYRRDLGGEWVGGGVAGDFSACQLAYRGGLKVELLSPEAGDGFLRRFLDRHGPGPHHLTFKVPDLVAALGEAEAAGYPAVGVDLSDPSWKEAFLHPKVAPGVVVQLAQAAGDWEAPPPADLPPAAVDRAAALRHVGHAVADLPAAVDLFGGVLGGRATGEGDGWSELAWDGGGAVRLLDAARRGDLADWVGDRAGRPHHLAFAVDDPAAVPGAEPAGDGCWEVAPGDNLGTRLVLVRG